MSGDEAVYAKNINNNIYIYMCICIIYASSFLFIVKMEVLSASGRCLTVLDDHTTVVMNSRPTSKIFTFDYAIHETATQEEIFATIGKPISNACLEGYNSTMLAYGQTGSGKSFTMVCVEIPFNPHSKKLFSLVLNNSKMHLIIPVYMCSSVIQNFWLTLFCHSHCVA
jgi:hypothetical protein